MKNDLKKTSSGIDVDGAPTPAPGPESILSNGRLIVCVAFIAAMLGIVYAVNLTPIYAANILIQIKQSSSLSGDPQAGIPTATAVEILRSRSVLSSVVRDLQLDVSVEPSLFPLVGAFIAGRNNTISEPGLFGAGGYVWGAEQARLSSFQVPDALLKRPFILTAGVNGEFTLSQEELGVRMSGTIGATAKAQTAYGPIEILVREIRAKPGAQFFVSRAPAAQVVEQLQKSLAISESGKQSNVIGVSLKGSRPDLISRTLNAIGQEYIRRHTAQRSDEVRKEQVFYDRQFEESQQRLQDLDSRLSRILRTHGISDLNEEARALVQRSVALQAELVAKQQRRDELMSRFLDNHPEVMLVSKHVHDLRADLKRIEARHKVLAEAQQEILNVTRDKQISSEINVALLNTLHKLDALTQSENANARLVDRAEVPVRPVTMSLSVMIALACLAGIVLGLLASLMKNTIVVGFR